MVLTMCIINIFVRFFTRMKFLRKKNKCRFSALSELPFEAHQYFLASLICYRVLLTKTWHWGLPCSPTFIKPTTIAIFIIHPIIGITVNSVNKHPFYGWMLIFAFTYTILFFHADWDLSMICLHGKLVECHLRSNPIIVANLERRQKKASKGRKFLIWPVFVLPKAMPPANDSQFNPRLKMFTVNSRHNGSQRVATFCLFHYVINCFKLLYKKKDCIQKWDLFPLQADFRFCGTLLWI